MGKVLLENKSDIKNREILKEEKRFSEKRNGISKVLLPNLVK